MSLTLLLYIGDVINQLNPGTFDTYQVNGVRLPDGRIVKLTDSLEKEYVGIRDNAGTSFYIRVNPSVNHAAAGRRIGSMTPPAQSVKSCRLVAFSFKEGIDSENLSAKLKTDLARIKFESLSTTARPTITVGKSNSHYIENFLEETQKKAFDMGSSFVCVSVDFDLRYSGDECTECEDFNPDDLYAIIVDADDEMRVIQRLKLGGRYPAFQFSGIDGGAPGTIYTNSLVGGTP
jgi:hypothetical protein